MAKKRMYSKKRNSKREYSRKTIKKSRRSKRKNTRKLNRHRKLRGGSGSETTVKKLSGDEPLLSGDETMNDLRRMVKPHRIALQAIINTIIHAGIGLRHKAEASPHRKMIQDIIESKKELMQAATGEDKERHRRDFEELSQLVQWQLFPFD